MDRAIRLAHRARFWARPNPHVGCVLVRDGDIVGEGFTQPAGENHAEIQALEQAGTRAAGATAYVTLEPCNHYGRTPPCAVALIRAGIGRVVLALEDPNPLVAGSGVQALREAGVTVLSGLMAGQVRRQLAGFLLRQERGRGRLRAKLAMSLDGRTAMASGESQWITGADARHDVQRLRAESCAVLTGIGTVMADDCALTVREGDMPADSLLPEPARRALRVVMDSELRTPGDSRVVAGGQRTLLLHGLEVMPAAGLTAQLQALPAVDGKLSPAAALGVLAERECNEILLESGPTLAGAFLREGLIDELLVYLAPKILGSSARPLFDLPLERMAQRLDLRLVDERRIGPDIRLTFHTGDRQDG